MLLTNITLEAADSLYFNGYINTKQYYRLQIAIVERDYQACKDIPY